MAEEQEEEEEEVEAEEEEEELLLQTTNNLTEVVRQLRGLARQLGQLRRADRELMSALEGVKKDNLRLIEGQDNILRRLRP